MVNDKYQMDFEALKHIFTNELVADTLVAVYCIAGKFRSGKSFILDLFLKYLMNGEKENWIDIEVPSSFKYSNSAERVTTGI